MESFFISTVFDLWNTSEKFFVSIFYYCLGVITKKIDTRWFRHESDFKTYPSLNVQIR